MKKNMIFHYPQQLVNFGNSGSQVRPYQMAEAFKNNGYEVELVTGNLSERKTAIKIIKNQVQQGRVFDFMYSETSTMPTALTEKNHFPANPLLDVVFFKWCKKLSIPAGIFYRDIHWRFEFYKENISLPKRAVSIPFYWYDWLLYQKYIDILYLPSREMASHLPTKWKKKIIVLPPGHNIYNYSEKEKRTDTGCLKLLYVGGITPPIYDLRQMFKAVSNNKAISLTVCCRKKEWEALKQYYNPTSNILIKHPNQNEIKTFYNTADIFCLLWKPNRYLNFAMPVKIFEAIGFDTPILTTSGTEAAKFIAQKDIGWSIDVGELHTVLKTLQNCPEMIEVKRNSIRKIKCEHTWSVRAKQVADSLMNIKC